MVGGNKNMSKENTAVTKKKIKRCKEDVVFDAACFIILTLVLFVVAYPLYWVIISSISAPSAVSSGKVLLHPIGFTLKGYAEVFKNDQVMRGFLNSLIITFCGVMVNLIVTLPTSYALSRSNFSGKKPITIFYLITMFFGGGLIPTYLVIQRLQMLNTIWALILPGCLSVYNMIVARTFFKSNISEELYEDGLETYLERVSLDMTNFTSKEAEEKKEKIFQCDYLKVDWEKHQVSIDGKEVHLTPMEYKILKLLIDNRGKVLTHNYILSQIWGSAQGVEAANLRVFMAALRRKIEKDPGNCRFILTEIGVGYRFREATE